MLICVTGPTNGRDLCSRQSARLPLSLMNDFTALGSNQVLRAPTPLTKDVSRVYPPISLFPLPSLLFASLPRGPAAAGGCPFLSCPSG